MSKYTYFLILLLLLSACSEKTEDVVLEKTTFSELKDFDSDDFSQAYVVFSKNCEAIMRKKGEFIDNSLIKINRADYVQVCSKLIDVSPKDFKAFVKDNFTPYLVVDKGSAEGKFTSYYETQINVSYAKDAKYKYPIYAKPYDMVELNLKDFDEHLPDKKILGRVKHGKLIPYFTRKEIYENGINAPIILWSDSYVDIYIMQIQGSAVAHLPDGKKLRIAFDESNGHKFKGIGSILLSKKLIPASQASMGNIKKWLNENFETAKDHMNENKRYIFHKISNTEGPVGALGVDLTAGRSLAVDRSIIPLGSLLWLETTLPDKTNLHRLVMAQDIGSAIRGAVRGDYFWGSGGDEVLEYAGKMNSKGRYYILLPKSSEIINGKKN